MGLNMEKISKCIIFTGGTPIHTGGFERSEFDNCLIIVADSGVSQLDGLNREDFCLCPDILLGDMDSFDKTEALLKFPDTEFIKFPPEKDYTDTQLAVDVAKKRGATNITIIGGTGNRADHYLANLALLRKYAYGGIALLINDGKNKISYCKNGNVIAEKNEKFKYFSIIPDGENLYGVTIKGAKYPLVNATVDRDIPVSVSNEITAHVCEVKVEKGNFFFILSSD